MKNMSTYTVKIENINVIKFIGTTNIVDIIGNMKVKVYIFKLIICIFLK